MEKDWYDLAIWIRVLDLACRLVGGQLCRVPTTNGNELKPGGPMN